MWVAVCSSGHRQAPVGTGTGGNGWQLLASTSEHWVLVVISRQQAMVDIGHHWTLTAQDTMGNRDTCRNQKAKGTSTEQQEPPGSEHPCQAPGMEYQAPPGSLQYLVEGQKHTAPLSLPLGD